MGVGVVRSADDNPAVAVSGANTVGTDVPGMLHGPRIENGLSVALRVASWLVLLGAATIPLASLGSYLPGRDVAYLAIGAGLLLGALLTTRPRPGAGATSFVVIPAVLAFVRLGPSAVPAVIFASLAANLVHGVRGRPLLVVTALDGFAFADAYLLASALAPDPWLSPMVFGAAFVSLRSGLWYLSGRVKVPLPKTPLAEQPGLLIPIALVPLAGLPIVAGMWLGDGSLLLMLAALLSLLILVREATNLASARAAAEVELGQLASASAAQQELVHFMTHELKNPLTSVRLYTQLGQRALQNQVYDNLPDYLGGIGHAEESLEHLIENLLQIGRMERNEALPTADPVNVVELVREVVDDLSSLSRDKQQTLIVEASSDLPTFSAPLPLLRSALGNLVSNAVKYTPEGGQVVVSASVCDDGKTLRLAVADTGFGLSEADRARLFTRFFRSSDQRVARERGSGLGLALTQAVVRRMGGSLEVVSELGRGSTFQVLFPIGSGAVTRVVTNALPQALARAT